MRYEVHENGRLRAGFCLRSDGEAWALAQSELETKLGRPRTKFEVLDITGEHRPSVITYGAFDDFPGCEEPPPPVDDGSCDPLHGQRMDSADLGEN
jgi:hypothetical protein